MFSLNMIIDGWLRNKLRIFKVLRYCILEFVIEMFKWNENVGIKLLNLLYEFKN